MLKQKIMNNLKKINPVNPQNPQPTTQPPNRVEVSFNWQPLLIAGTLAYLFWPKKSTQMLGAPAPGMTVEEEQILEVLTEEPWSVDKIIDHAGLPAAQVAGALTLLEIKGMVQAHAGNQFSLPIKKKKIDHKTQEGGRDKTS